MDLSKELNSLMVKYRFRPNKKMGQIFIVDSEIIGKLVELAELKKTDVVLEIGAGTGFLTRALQKKCSVVAFELDDTLFDLLEHELEKEKIELLHKDFLAAELPEFNKVVSLPPYTISTDILYRLFGKKFEIAVFVFQTEFAERLAAEPGFFDYNALSVLTHYFFDVKVVKKVSSKSFFPRPNAQSAIVKLVRKNRKKRVHDTKLFISFIKSVFRFQNKNLCNALRSSYDFIETKISREEFEERLQKLDLKDVKVKLISCDEFIAVFTALFA
ncbi:MAG: ribosomal RNA small subunit methyltransferase A [Candidatus Diapherotrites archaeon]|nr:ribosomal RNA small subunit methyltransferase A [Candidatus Diapherotrites archaeon]